MAFTPEKTVLRIAATSALSLLFSFYLLLLWLPVTAAAPSNFSKRENITVEVPEGSRYLPAGKLLCSPSTWKTIATFFLANYCAHALTIKPSPGQTTLQGLIWAALALLLPTSGLVPGLNAISQCVTLRSQPLDAVSRAGALCVVVRTSPWRAQDGDVVRGVRSGLRDPNAPKNSADKLWEREMTKWEKKKARQEKKLQRREGEEDHVAQSTKSEASSDCDAGPTLGVETFVPGSVMHFLPAKNIWSLRNRKVNGVCCLPPGYALAMLPKGTKVDPFPSRQKFYDRDEGHDRGWKAMWQASWRPRNPFRRFPSLSVIIAHHRAHDPFLPLPDLEPPRYINPTGCSSDEIQSSYSFSKNAIAIFQTIFASLTLYEARGDQIERFGYAAFGLTVTPYLVMSLVNLCGNLMTPDYPAVHLVKTDVLDEAEKRPGGHFEGMVAQMAEVYRENTMELSFKVDSSGQTSFCVTSSSDLQSTGSDWKTIASYKNPMKTALDEVPPNAPTFLIPGKAAVHNDHDERMVSHYKVLGCGLLINMLTIAIVGALSGFKKGSSSTAQRVWTTMWLIYGMIYGMLSHIIFDSHLSEDYWRMTIEFQLVFTIFGAPAIGGFVVVGQMLQSFGSCKELY